LLWLLLLLALLLLFRGTTNAIENFGDAGAVLPFMHSFAVCDFAMLDL
jgi:hypothetical protein